MYPCTATRALAVAIYAVATLPSGHHGGTSSGSGRPSVLFATPIMKASTPGWYGWADSAYMQQLYNGTPGFEVDFLDSQDDLNRSRLFRYHAVVLFLSPNASSVLHFAMGEEIPGVLPSGVTIRRFLPLIREFVTRGGGVFLFPSEQNWHMQMMPDLTELFEVILPVELLHESNASNCERMSHMRQQGSGNVAFTDSIDRAHPATQGVRGVWFPTDRNDGSAGFTGAVIPSANWTVLVRGSATCRSMPINLTDPQLCRGDPACKDPPPHFVQRVGGEAAPALFAVREFGAGRVAILNQWRQFTVAAGSRWLYNSEIMSRGFGDRPSDMGRLLSNTFTWLAEPARSSSSGLGGYETPPSRLVPPNQKLTADESFPEPAYDYQPSSLLPEADPASTTERIFRGLFGAQSAISVGTGTVEDFAKVAKRNKLDFLVMLEQFSQPHQTMQQADLEKLKAACAAASSPAAPPPAPGTDPSCGTGSVGGNVCCARSCGDCATGGCKDRPGGEDACCPEAIRQANRSCADGEPPCVVSEVQDSALKVFPGYTIDTQFGNRMIFWGNAVKLPDKSFLTADGKRLLFDLLDPNNPHNQTGSGNQPFWQWIISSEYPFDCDHEDTRWSVGYFHLGPSAPAGSLKMYDLHIFAQAATHFYENNTLVEDLTTDYLLTVASGIPPNPIAVSLVTSPQALQDAVDASHMLAHARTATLERVVCDGLHWVGSYASLPTFVANSRGPRVESWPHTSRNYVLATERFVPGQSLDVLPLSVTAGAGGPLVDIKIFNGNQLFRRFLPPPGAQKFYAVLLLDIVHRDLVVVATDADGNKAMTSPARNWKAGANGQVVWCGDHTNDCSDWPLLLHGPGPMVVNMMPNMDADEAGVVWDGGPKAAIPLLILGESRPFLRTLEAGTEDAARFMQIPRLEYTDEVTGAVTSEQTRTFADSVERVGGPWDTMGPIAGPSRLMNVSLRHRHYIAPSIGLPLTQYPGFGKFQGSTAQLFRSEIQFLKDFTVQTLIAITCPGCIPQINPLTQFSMAFGNSTGEPITVHGAALLQVADSTFANGTARPAAYPYNQTFTLEPGGWFAVWSTLPSQASFFFNRQHTISVSVAAPETGACDRGIKSTEADLHPNGMVEIRIPPIGKVKAGDSAIVELAMFNTDLFTSVNSLQDVLAVRNYLRAPPSLVVARGERVVAPSAAGLVEVRPDERWAAELAVGRHNDTEMLLPVRVGPFISRWTVGLYQFQGYSLGHYTDGSDVYTGLGLDDFRLAHVPLYTGRAQRTHVQIGHPVIARGLEAEKLFLQVTQVNHTTWHCSLNNPTDHAISVKLDTNLRSIGLQNRSVSVPPGAYVVVM